MVLWWVVGMIRTMIITELRLDFIPSLWFPSPQKTYPLLTIRSNERLLLFTQFPRLSQDILIYGVGWREWPSPGAPVRLIITIISYQTFLNNEPERFSHLAIIYKFGVLRSFDCVKKKRANPSATGEWDDRRHLRERLLTLLRNKRKKVTAITSFQVLRLQFVRFKQAGTVWFYTRSPKPSDGGTNTLGIIGILPDAHLMSSSWLETRTFQFQDAFTYSLFIFSSPCHTWEAWGLAFSYWTWQEVRVAEMRSYSAIRTEMISPVTWVLIFNSITDLLFMRPQIGALQVPESFTVSSRWVRHSVIDCHLKGRRILVYFPKSPE